MWLANGSFELDDIMQLHAASERGCSRKMVVQGRIDADGANFGPRKARTASRPGPRHIAIDLENLTGFGAVCPPDAHDKILARHIHHASAHEEGVADAGRGDGRLHCAHEGRGEKCGCNQKRRAVMKNSLDLRDRLARFPVFWTGDGHDEASENTQAENLCCRPWQRRPIATRSS